MTFDLTIQENLVRNEEKDGDRWTEYYVYRPFIRIELINRASMHLPRVVV